MAWLLVPEAFGVIAIISVLLIGVNLLTDFGLSASIIRSKRGTEHNFINTLWTLQIIRGVVMWIICLLIAEPIASFYNEEILSILVPVAGFVFIVKGFRSTSLALLNRKLEIKKIIIWELSSQLLGILVMVTYGVFDPVVWALIVGSIVDALTKTVSSFFVGNPIKHKLYIENEAFLEIFGFGKWLFVSSLFNFLATNFDKLILGKLVALSTLGVYHIAKIVADIPLMVIQQLSSRVLYPLYSFDNRSSEGLIYSKIVRLRNILLAFVLLMVICIVVLSEIFFTNFYRDSYIGASWIAPLLCINVWIVSLQATLDGVPLAMGLSRITASVSIIATIAKIFFSIVGFLLFELQGFILGLALGSLVSYTFFSSKLKQLGFSFMRQDLLFTLYLGLTVVLYYGMQNVNGIIFDVGPYVLSIGFIFIAITVFILYILFYVRVFPAIKHNI